MSQGPSVTAGGLMLSTVQLVVIGLSLLVMAGTHVLLRYTRLGKAMRATAANQTLARNCGIRTGRVITATWAITGALCGLAGVVFAMDAGSFGATSTDLFLVLILAAVFLGGPGQAYGAMLGAVIIGLATEISAAYITPDYKYVIAFVALLVMLGVRPTGLLGKPAYELVLRHQPAHLRRRRRDGLPRPEPAVRGRRASPTSASSSSRPPAATRPRSWRCRPTRPTGDSSPTSAAGTCRSRSRGSARRSSAA